MPEPVVSTRSRSHGPAPSQACVFCDVAAGRAEGVVVHAGASCLAIMDLHPVRRGHVLVMPRAHATRLDACPEPVQEEIFRLGRAVAAAQCAAGLSEAAAFLLLDGPSAGQHVQHAHLHVVPRRPGDTLLVVVRFVARMLLALFGRTANRAELGRDAERIRAHLVLAGGGGAAPS